MKKITFCWLPRNYYLGTELQTFFQDANIEYTYFIQYNDNTFNDNVKDKLVFGVSREYPAHGLLLNFSIIWPGVARNIIVL